MTLNSDGVRQCLKSFDFTKLFIEELGWDCHSAILDVSVDGHSFTLAAIAHKRGMAAFVCPAPAGSRIPDYPTRRKIERQVTKSVHEHILIYTDADKTTQVWQWVKRELGRPTACREHTYHRNQPGDALIQKLGALAVALDEEEGLTLVDVTSRIRAAFDVERVTKRFYDRFKDEHAAFLRFVKGIPDEEMERWYVSVMLNRLMFIYFIQKKGFLDNDIDYLRNKLAASKAGGRDRFYADLLCPLFFEGFAKRPQNRSADTNRLLGKVPYLNGGIFLRHQIEELHGRTITIPDRAFEQLFAFFDAYQWHLDERPLRRDDEINPDVLGYIFEKYINQKQMGAYYTKEDITGYISQNTVIPFLFDAAREKCKVAFETGAGTAPASGCVWRLLQEDPDRYIYPAVRHGVIRDDGSLVPETELPDFVQTGMHDPKARMHDKRYNLQQAPQADPIRLVTETWREYIHRRTRCLELRQKLQSGTGVSPVKASEDHGQDGRATLSINDLITYNLDIRQFAQDVVENCEGPELLVAFWKAIKSVSVLDPACGSGAFLFAALNILEPLYEACIERMRFFLDEWGADGRKNHPNYHKLFTETLKRVESHPNLRYFILKSIIVNNLYGVDIMEEAVEICKLRLFLKLVAQVEDVDHIEPLPDIDFNIRAGNTLVGYVSEGEVRKALTGQAQAQTAMQFGEDKAALKAFEVKVADAQQTFDAFRHKQLEGDGWVPPKDKEEVLRRFAELDAELNRCLASDYGINPSKIPNKKKYEDEFAAWHASHRPFHWFVDFYGTLKGGGFDVVIGNPPYVEWAKIREYDISQEVFTTRSCGNIYTCMMERSTHLLSPYGRIGEIVPLSCVSTKRMQSLRDLWSSQRLCSWLTYYSGDGHPSVLFPGVKFRLCISIHARRGIGYAKFSGRYNRWLAEERPFVFPLQNPLIRVPDVLIQNGLVPKLGSDCLGQLLMKAAKQPSRVKDCVRDRSDYEVYCHRIVAHFVKAVDFVPFFRSERDGEKKSEDYKSFPVDNAEMRSVLCALLNSSLFYWWYLTYSDVYHCGRELILDFPCDVKALQQEWGKDIAGVTFALMRDLRENSVRRRIPYRTTGLVEYDEYYPRLSKPIIDQIDRVLAKHYGFTDEELDFIINYDIKYRMGGTEDADE